MYGHFWRYPLIIGTRFITIYLVVYLLYIYHKYVYLHQFYCISARVGLMHIGVFILLLLSGERNFGVRLNKPYTVRVPMDIPVFTGTHADFLIIVSITG